MKRRAAFASRPPSRSFRLVARAFARRLRLLHSLRHLRFHGVKIETRAPLHRWIFDENLEFLSNHLLDEDKAPELIIEPIEVLLRTVHSSVSLRPLAIESGAAHGYSRSMTTFSLPSFTAFMRILWSRSL